MVDRNGNPVAMAPPLLGNSGLDWQDKEMIGNALAMRQEMLKSWMDPRRDINKECGYPETSALSSQGYKDLYDREPIAERVVKVWPKECWQVNPTITDDEDAETETPFEKRWKELGQNLLGGKSYHRGTGANIVWDYLKRLDILSRIGHFGVLLLGFNDGKNLQEPVEGAMTINGERHHDGYLTANEEEKLRNLPGLTDQETTVINNMAADRKIILNAIVSRKTKEAQTGTRQQSGWAGIRDSVSSPFGSQQPTTEDIQGTDRSYDNSPVPEGNPGAGGSYGQQFGASYGLSPSPDQEKAGGNLAGTDQQYFGIQFGPSEQPSQEASKKNLDLLFLRPFDESLVQVVRYEWNVFNPRFGMPVMYRITLNDPREQHSGIGLPMATVFVHWSRVIHVADNLNSSEIFGVPAQRPVFNRLMDLLKLYGGSAEMYWKGAFNGISLETHPQLGGDVTIDAADIRNQMENYQNGLQRYLALMGISAKTLAPTISDPSSTIDKQLEAICIELEIPKRVFMGSERGELASSQDDSSWNDRVKARQNGHVTTRIIVPFVDRLISVGVLPEPQGQLIPDRRGFKMKAAEQPQQEGFGGKSPFGGAPGKPAFSQDNPESKPNPFVKNAFGDQMQRGLPEDQDLQDDEPGAEQIPFDEELPGETDQEEVDLGEEGLDPLTGEPEIPERKEPGYTITWPDLDSNTDQAKASIALSKTQALAAYIQGNVEAVMPLMDYLTRVMDFTQDEARAIIDSAEMASMTDERVTDDPGLMEQDRMGQEQEQFAVESELKDKAIKKGLNPFEQKTAIVGSQPQELDEEGNPVEPEESQAPAEGKVPPQFLK